MANDLTRHFAERVEVAVSDGERAGAGRITFGQQLVYEYSPQLPDVVGAEHAQQGCCPQLVGAEAVVVGARHQGHGESQVCKVDRLAHHALD
jgi:hypothetical protein